MKNKQMMIEISATGFAWTATVNSILLIIGYFNKSQFLIFSSSGMLIACVFVILFGVIRKPEDE